MSRGAKKKKGARGPGLDWTAYLRGQGVAPGPVTPEVDAAAELLAGTSDRVPEVTGDVAEALCAALSADGKLDLLGRCTSEGSRALAKAARRALHSQRRRGVDVPQVRSRGPAPAAALGAGQDAPDQHADARAHMSAPFGDGHRILLFRFRGTTDRVLHAAAADLSDAHGLRDLKLYRGGAKVYRTMVTESRSKLPGASVPFFYALHLVQRAVARTQEAGRLVPEHVGTLRTLLGSGWPVSDAHPGDELVVAEELDNPEQLFTLWELPELRTWIPTDETLAELTKAVGEVLESKLVVVELSRAKRLREVLGQAVARELDGEAGQRWDERLRDAAWVLHENQQPGPAAQLLAVRRELQQSDTPDRLVFFHQLLGRLLLDRLPPELTAELIPGIPQAHPDAPEPEAEPGGVIWTPGSSNEPSKGGTGGLIIPGR